MNCYNSEKYLKAAIDSVYAQTHQNWEIIFIDNCSTDNSARIAAEYDSRLKYYQTKNTIPLGEARNVGLQYCQGDFLCFLDTDDMYLPAKLTRQLAMMLENPTLQMSYGGVTYIDEQDETCGELIPNCKTGNVFPGQLRRYEINMQSVMVRNDIVMAFDNTLEFSPDYDLFMQICSEYKVGVIKEILVRYRRAANSLTNQKMSRWGIEVKSTLDKIFTKNPELIKKYPKEQSFAYAKAAYYKAQYSLSTGKQQDAVAALGKYKWISGTYFGLYVLALFPYSIWEWVHERVKNR